MRWSRGQKTQPRIFMIKISARKLFERFDFKEQCKKMYDGLLQSQLFVIVSSGHDESFNCQRPQSRIYKRVRDVSERVDDLCFVYIPHLKKAAPIITYPAN